MSRTRTRVISGFATTVFVGFGVALTAPAALADNDDVETMDDGAGVEIDEHYVESYDFVCSAEEAPESHELSLEVGLTVADTAETGETLMAAASSESYMFGFPNEEVEAGDHTQNLELQLSGEAAPQDDVSFEQTNTESYTHTGEDVELELDEPTPVELDLVNPGELVFVPASVTTTIEHASGTVTTVCEVEGESEPLAATDVSGDPIEDEDDDEDDGEDQDPPEEDDGEDQDPPEDDNGDDTAPEDEGDDKAPEDEGEGDDTAPEDEADDQLPVTGAALGGLVAAAVAALGGGGAAMYLARKRKAAVGTEE